MEIPIVKLKVELVLDAFLLKIHIFKYFSGDMNTSENPTMAIHRNIKSFEMFYEIYSHISFIHILIWVSVEIYPHWSCTE